MKYLFNNRVIIVFTGWKLSPKDVLLVEIDVNI